MKTNPIKFALSLVALCTFTGTAIAGDQEGIQGTWKCEAVTMMGKALPVVAVEYIFARESLIIRPLVGKEQTLTFTLDLSEKPPVLVTQLVQPSPGAKAERVPYELRGDTLKIMPISPGEHVTEISDQVHVVITLKRTTP